MLKTIFLTSVIVVSCGEQEEVGPEAKAKKNELQNPDTKPKNHKIEKYDCGVEEYNSGRDERCGVEAFKLARSDACGVLRYNMGSDPVCGEDATKTSIAESPCMPEIVRDAVSQGARNFCTQTLGGASQILGIPRCEVSGFLGIKSPGVKVQCKLTVYKICEHEKFGVASFNECRHENHGVELYRECPQTKFGIKKMKICERQVPI